MAANDGRFDDAERFFQIVLKADQESASAWSNLGNVHLSLGRPQDATQEFSKAIALAPEVNFACKASARWSSHPLRHYLLVSSVPSIHNINSQPVETVNSLRCLTKTLGRLGAPPNPGILICLASGIILLRRLWYHVHDHLSCTDSARLWLIACSLNPFFACSSNFSLHSVTMNTANIWLEDSLTSVDCALKTLLAVVLMWLDSFGLSHFRSSY